MNEANGDTITVSMDDGSLESRVVRLQQQLSDGLNAIQNAGAGILALSRELLMHQEDAARNERLSRAFEAIEQEDE